MRWDTALTANPNLLKDADKFNFATSPIAFVGLASIADPGASGAIPVTTSGFVPLVSGGAETRSLADATRAGQILILSMKTDEGNITLTTASPMNQTGNNTAVFGDAGDTLVLVSMEDGADYEWRVLINDGITLSTV